MQQLIPNQSRIMGFILSVMPNKVDAEDILQDVLTEMWNKFDQFTPGTNFAAWGCTIAKYKIIEFRRKSKDSRMLFNDDLIRILEQESHRKMNIENIYTDALEQCVQKLTAKEIGLLKRRYENNQTFKEIASQVGISLQGVHKAISNIHTRLVRCIRCNLNEKGTV